ncbi:hypothetical protein Tco_0968181 [Tanacetum coccineum]
MDKGSSYSKLDRGDPSRSVSIRKQLETDAMWCYFDAFLTSVEPKNFKQAMTEPSWINAIQEEIHEFERLEVWRCRDNPSHVYKLKKALYDLKQAPRAWYDMLSSFSFLNTILPRASRPDLNYAVCLCARYQAKPTEKHLQAVKRIFRYLNGTINMGLWYSKDTEMSLTAYADADHAGC